jgi:hypothetical protein
MEPGDASNLLTQMRRGALPYCVLALLRDKERYGVEIVRLLAEVEGLLPIEAQMTLGVIGVLAAVIGAVLVARRDRRAE